jgi:hypothetical protein
MTRNNSYPELTVMEKKMLVIRPPGLDGGCRPEIHLLSFYISVNLIKKQARMRKWVWVMSLYALIAPG